MSVHRAAGTSPDPPDPRMRSGTQQICCDHVPASWGSVKSGPQEWQQLLLLPKETEPPVTSDFGALTCSFSAPTASATIGATDRAPFSLELSRAAGVQAGSPTGEPQPRSALQNVNRTFLIASHLLNRRKRFVRSSVRCCRPIRPRQHVYISHRI